MEAEAQRQGLSLSKSQLAELQPLAGRNPMLARKVIRNEKLGLKQKNSCKSLSWYNERLCDFCLGRSRYASAKQRYQLKTWLKLVQKFFMIV